VCHYSVVVIGGGAPSSYEDFREFNEKFEMVLIGYSGTRKNVVHKKLMEKIS
jgi:hypothetical protein